MRKKWQCIVRHKGRSLDEEIKLGKQEWLKKQKEEKVVKKPLPKDWQPKYLNGNIIDLTPLLDDSWWLIKPEEPEDEDTSIPIEEKINQIAYQRKLAENKLFGLNEEFAKQKLRERMS